MHRRLNSISFIITYFDIKGPDAVDVEIPFPKFDRD